MKSVIKIAVLTLLVGLGACSSSMLATSTGTKIDQSQLSQFKSGQTTYTQVTQAVGLPTRTIMLTDGSRIATYVSSTSQPNAGNFLLGLDKHGAATTTSTVTMNFDQNGVLKNYQTTQTNR